MEEIIKVIDGKASRIPIPDATKINPIDLAWLAGIWEGEGCFYLEKHTLRARMVISNSDLDVMEHVAAIMKAHVVHSKARGFGRKPLYTIHMNSIIALAWMKLLYPLMGNRRKAKIAEIISHNEK